MQLQYFYVVFEDDAEDCPGELWESILNMLRVVFASYGYLITDETEPHELHVICEDDANQSIFESLPQYVVNRITKKKNITKKVKPFVMRTVPSLLEDFGLSVVNNIKLYLGMDQEFPYTLD